MGFLGDLADQLSSQFSLGENTNNTLDANGVKYGALGGFATQFDQSAERRYVEEGYLRKDPYNTVPKQFEILTQEPNATILVKKRMFSSIAENFRPDFMDADERLYYRTIKILFQNKCNQIAALEKISKIQKVTSVIGQIDNYMIPLILNLTDSFSQNFSESALVNDGEGDKLVKVVDRLRRVYAYNITSPHTSWITDNTNMFKSQYAEGTGVIEITNFSNIKTTTTVDINNPGTCSFAIQDPYQAMLITEYDIERAIADATNLFYKSKTYQLGKENSQILINELQTRLNQWRANRGASPITFKINPDTLLGKRVVAIIDRLGISIPFTYNAIGSLLTLGFNGGQNVGVEVPPEYLKDGAIAGFDGLDKSKQKYSGASGINDNFNISGNMHLGPDSELNLFCKLVKAIFDRLTLIANSENAFQTANKKTNYTRRKLRFNFLGKLIIQPMDVVHVYMTSKSKFDNRLLGGLSIAFNGLGFLQKMNNQLTDLKNAFDTVFNPKANLDLQIEKAAFVGAEFPTWLWNMMRSQFVSENEGVHVFGGIIESALDSYSDGNFSINVACRDNTAYFDKGKVNFKPGVDVFNGTIYDPLTPFKTNFDTITSNAKTQTPELLEENKWLLSETTDSGKGEVPITKYKNGPSVGLPITEKTIIQDKSLDPTTGLLTRTFYAPNGLVYKWKEGIGVLTQCGSSTELNGPNRVGLPNISKDPFAGQDIMNVLSLLITGVPYNFATYWKAVGSPNYSGDPNANKNAASTYYESIRGSLSKNNLLWGNFIPFKTLSIDEQSYVKNLQGQFSIVQQNDELNAKLKKLQEVFNQAKAYAVVDILKEGQLSSSYPNQDSLIASLDAEQKALQNQINAIIEDMQKKGNNKSYYSFGDDVSFDINDDADLNSTKPEQVSEAQRAAYRKKLRKQINNLTRRMSYNVRANDDRNLFIVDDSYDKDYDIMSYNQALADGLRLFSNEFVNIRENIKNTASLLNLEVYCDTQGHIRARSPQYNRMPSSVFYNMMYMRDTMGVQVFPQFLKDLFDNQLETLRLQIEIVEDQIRLYCALLGFDTDSTAYEFIRINSSDIDTKAGNTSGFDFISGEDGEISSIADILKLANPDLGAFWAITTQAARKQDTFRPSDRAKNIIQAITNKKLDYAGYGIDEVERIQQNQRIQVIIERINTKSALRVKLSDYISQLYINYGDGVVAATDYTVDIFKVFDELSSKIADRQRAVKLFALMIKNYREYTSLDENDEVANQLLAPGNYGNSNVPEVFAHMIEDETYDDLGPGSGKRFIIRRPQIKSMNFAEHAPSFTTVEVRGTLNSFNPDALPQGFNAFPSGGNALTTAIAVDYDMWRNYGFTSAASITVPFLQDPNLQCAPYASMILSRARKDIFRGTVVIAGNEYMQPGEVVFVEDRGMLFYIQSVTHSFAFGSGFTTTLELTYGHAPGEYIPTPLDMMGKMLYNNRDLSNIVIQRQSSAFNEAELGVILRDPTTSVAIDNLNTTRSNKNHYAQQNLKTINNILYSVQQFINENTSGVVQEKITRVELRLYYDDNNKITPELDDFADTIKKTLRGEQDLGPNASYDANVKANVPWIANKNAVQTVYINMSDENEPRSPSQSAIYMARDWVTELSNMNKGGAEDATNQEAKDNNGGVDELNDAEGSSKAAIKKKISKLRSVLYKYIVDCWIVYEDNPTASTQ